MKNPKILLSVLLTIPFLLAGCGTKHSDKTVEDILPADANIAFVFDYSNKDQIKLVHDMAKAFPKTNFGEDFWTGFEEGFNKNGGNLKIMELLNVFDGKWQVGMAIQNPIEEVAPEGVVYMAGVFDKSDDMAKFVKKNVSATVKYSKDGDFEFWIDDTAKSETAKSFVFRYMDLFVMTNTRATMDAAVERVKNGGGGLKENKTYLADVASSDGGRLGYVLMGDISKIDPSFKQFSSSVAGKYFDILDGLSMIVKAEKGGIRMVSKMTTKGDASAIFPNPDYKSRFIDEVSGDGMMFFEEVASFRPLFESAIVGGVSAFYTAQNAQKGTLAGDAAYSQSLYSGNPLPGVIHTIAGVGGVADADIEAILNGAFAMAISDSGTYLPTLSFYIDVNEHEVVAKTFAAHASTYVAQMLNGLGAMATGGANLFKQEKITIDGNLFYKVSLDLSTLPATVQSALKTYSVDVEKLKIELYTGVTSQNALVIAFYPDFANDYGRNPLSGQAMYKEAITKVQDGSQIAYMSAVPLANLLGRIYDVVDANMPVADGDKEAQKKKDSSKKDVENILKMVSAFKYMISTTAMKDGLYTSDAFMAIEKAK